MGHPFPIREGAHRPGPAGRLTDRVGAMGEAPVPSAPRPSATPHRDLCQDVRGVHRTGPRAHGPLALAEPALAEPASSYAGPASPPVEPAPPSVIRAVAPFTVRPRAADGTAPGGPGGQGKP
ncbi:hypothetical protein JS756_02420 [Streptomyces actuosus]|uniref:Uncharacterized protein n=1 Tax=Streptomyces actuosus TaxID=1885 RepID=A0ABS2VIR4_STRAS|nr:hypothetical protein [Streptomyces actuosus]MBN0042987.1 hypothetical protein [Streptomyces actuosus]